MSSHPLSVRKPIPWGFLVWTLPLLYVFWAPYQQRAGWLEWTATTLTLLAVLALFLTALTDVEHRRLVAGICVALLLIASGFLAYRPSGGLYVPVAAAFAPAAAGGGIRLSMTVVSAVAVLFGLEWCLLYLDGSQGAFFPLVVAAQTFVSGVGARISVSSSGGGQIPPCRPRSARVFHGDIQLQAVAAFGSSCSLMGRSCINTS